MADLVDAMWGPQPEEEAQKKRMQLLDGYIGHCEKETSFACESSSTNPTTRASLLKAIQSLKTKPKETRASLRADSPPVRTAGVDSFPLPLAVQLTYATACLSPGTVGGDIFHPSWKESESLTKYIDRVYPRMTDPIQDTRTVRIHKLSASYLDTYATVRLRWTNQLTDHLILLKGDGWKSLYIFRHPAFLRHSLEILGANNPDLEQSTDEALSLGCLPPLLLRETLMTFDLIFPSAGDRPSRAILEREVERNGLDPYFLKSSPLQHEHHNNFRDALDPDDVRSLYEKYPYWGDRLYDLWKEADDPTPVTSVERWTEARRNPRFTYWCTVVSVSLAITFGMVATTLGAVQVWISYCAWVADPTRPLCGT
ncbi:hypothetical protein B0T19DRAFT_201809 [Cercophora scortea]|uniref:Uncharacterized protein n=1 Tax=Cercophora scortea TaxID=314031 RepID=A0AAE0M8F7_9PEZI|nr:hypothetical protein B0T19DRAFT_201809 [Cercophora scortea]